MWTHQQVLDHEAKLARAKLNKMASHPSTTYPPAARETGRDGLQQKIMDWCDAQWPKWVYDFPRTDLKSTLPVGRHDSTIWGPFPKCYLIETKAKNGKLSEDQRIWICRMNALGWKVHVVFSLEELMEIVKEEK